MSTTQPESLMIFSLPRKRNLIPMIFAILTTHLAGILKDFVSHYIYFIYILFIFILHITYFRPKDLIIFTHLGTYSAFFQLPIRNSMNGIHNPAANALPTMKKVNFARYLTFSLKAQSITKRNIRAMPLVV